VTPASLSAHTGVRVAAPEGFSPCNAYPAHTIPGSLAVIIGLLVSIIATINNIRIMPQKKEMVNRQLSQTLVNLIISIENEYSA
jgi:hypothetical protein